MTSERDGAVGVVLMNRPAQLNALSDELMDALVAALEELDADAGVRCIVLGGGERAFAAGADIAQLATMSAVDVYLTRRIEEGTRQLRHANDQLIARDGEVLHSLRTAGRLQTKIMLPPAPPKRPGLTWALHYEPLDHFAPMVREVFAKPKN